MQKLESLIMWRIVAPLVVASVIAAGSSAYTIARLSVAVSNLEDMQKQLVTKTWANGQFNMTKYRIKNLEAQVSGNEDQIRRNHELIKHYHPDNQR